MNALSVHLGEIQIGLLEHFEDESEVFTFSESYLESHINSRPVLGQLFEDRMPKPIEVGGPICWFEHLLPQGVMRKWRARHLGIDDNDSFEMLAFLGEQLPDAVVLRPAESLIERQPPKQLQRIAFPSDTSFHFSLAGVQWKLSARSQGRGLTITLRPVVPEHVAKLIHQNIQVCRGACEFATMHWAKEAGLHVPQFQLKCTGF
ncbi:MAG: HipA N-terminal domain-containing protein [Pirellulaceae bacterium]